MEVKAKAKFIKMSPKKVRLVIDVVRGMDVNDAIDQLSFLHKAASSPVRKLLDSAIANAEHNFSLSRSNLYIKEVRADEGPKIKRWAPKAFGRAGMIRKRSTHISLLLGERVPTKQKRTAKTTSQEARKGDVKEVSQKPVEALEKAMPHAPQDMSRASEEVSKEVFDKRMRGKHRDAQNKDKKDLGKKKFVNKIFNRKAQ